MAGAKEVKWAEPREKPHQKGPELGKDGKPLTAAERRVLAQQKKDRAKALLLRTLGTDTEPKVPAWMLTPDGKVRVVLDLLAFAASIYILFAEAFLASFDIRPAPTSVIVLSSLFDFVLAANTITHFVTGYRWLAADGVWKTEMRPQRVAFRYLTTWFALDTAGAFPVQLVMWMVDPAGHMGYPGPVLLKVFQVGKCLRIVKVYRDIADYQERTASRFALIVTLKAIFTALLFCHWVACLWFIIVKEAQRIQETYPEDPEVCSDRNKLMRADQSDQYSCAMYWAVQTLTTTGYGDMTPASQPERTYVVFAIIGGVIALVYVVLNVTTLVDNTRRHHRWYQREVTAMLNYMSARNLPTELIQETRSYYDYRWETSKGYDDLSMIRQLPVNMRIRAFHHLNQALALNVDFLALRGLADTAFWTIVLQELEQHTHVEGTWLEREGQASERIVIIKEGEVQVFHETSGYIFEVLKRGSWLGGTRDLSTRGCNSSARANSNVTTYELPEKGVRRIMAAYQDCAQLIESTFHMRVRRNSGARWKIAWMKHKQTILQMAAILPKPPPPWPKPSGGVIAAVRRQSSLEPKSSDPIPSTVLAEQQWFHNYKT